MATGATVVIGGLVAREHPGSAKSSLAETRAVDDTGLDDHHDDNGGQSPFGRCPGTLSHDVDHPASDDGPSDDDNHPGR